MVRFSGKRVRYGKHSAFWMGGAVCLVLLGSLGCSNRHELNWSDYRKVAKTATDGNARVQPGAFGSGGMPYGSGTMPYGSGMMPYGSGAMPYGSGMMPFGSGAMPYGSGARSFGSGTPFGSGAAFAAPPATRSATNFPPFGSAYPAQ
ncbi:MAG: hypothetical protein Q8M16_17170 [Pirellulaceae bacterium]|nr:hypothetical protein [Pirellulaceae bacterium]